MYEPDFLKNLQKNFAQIALPFEMVLESLDFQIYINNQNILYAFTRKRPCHNS